MKPNIISFRGKTPLVSPKAFIAPSAQIIGDVEIGAGSSLWYNCVVRGDINEIRIGVNSNIQDGTVIHVESRRYGAYIGDRVTVGHMALLHACTLEDDAMVGMQATVMDGAVVESGGLVAAGALVPPGKRVLKGQVWAGSPAKYMRDIRPSDQEMIGRIWPIYETLSREYIEAGLDDWAGANERD